MKSVPLNNIDKSIKEESQLRWIMKASWRKLTRGERIARVILKTLRFVILTAIVAAIISVVIGVVLGVLVAMGIVNAFIGGFENASRVNTGRFYGHYKWR